MSSGELSGARRYMDHVCRLLDDLEATQAEAIGAAAGAVVRTLERDGTVYLFGSGHSHLLAEEGHYRAGGLAAVTPILASGLMLHESAAASTRLERTRGVGPAVLERYGLTEKDTLFVFSNSGVNAAPVEAAQAAKAAGATVVAVVSLAYCAQTPAAVEGQKLPEFADIVVDNRGVRGDAVVELPGCGLFTGAVSTISGAFILNAVLTEAVWRLAEMGHTPPIYISANLPGAADHNQALVARFRARNPHL